VKKQINFQHILFLLYILLLLFPENSGSLIPSLPIDNLYEFIILIISIYAGLKIINQRKIFLYYVFAIFIIKLILLTQATNLWELCYQDNIAPRAPEEIIQTRDYDFSCEKNYQLNTLKKTTYVKEVNFVSNSHNEWRGANASNFHLGFFNSKKFNHRGEGNLDRKWLPFELKISKKNIPNTNSINVVFLGEIEIYKNKEKIYEAKSYIANETITLSDIQGAELDIYFKFNKENPIKIIDERAIEYPADRYASIQIFDSNMNLLKSEKSNLTKLSELVFLIILLSLLYTYRENFYSKKIIKYLENRKIIIFITVFLFYLTQNHDLISLFPIFGIIDSYTVFIYLSVFLIFYFYDLNPVEIFILSTLTTFLLLDIDFKILDQYIRPGGSDSLTYEYFSRLVLEGNFLEGGESVYTYSPGARYFLFFLHIAFGERLKYIFILLNSLAAFLSIVNKKFKVDQKNVFAYIAFIYLTSNAINRIFMYGMSEIFSLILIMFYLKSEKLKNNYPLVSGIILGLAMFNRVNLVLGIIALVILSKNKKTYFGFSLFALVPSIHNLYYGKKFLILTDDWNYQGEVLGESFNFNDFVINIYLNILRNFDFVVMNPFSENIFNRTGRFLPLVFFISILLFLFYVVKNRKDIVWGKYLLELLPIILIIAPFAIYDPRFFYPRFLIIPHLMFLIYGQNLKNEFN
tara:strand:+ start:480 stop:2549 length:2070 start_codon:yes stop_codon:yes gene_type:complete